MDDTKLPRDEFSTLRRALMDNPGALNARSIVDITDFYGRLVTWNVETFRHDGQTTTFVQQQSADGALRLVFPADVMKVIYRHDTQLVGRSRGIAAQKALMTRRERGDVIGNAAALAKARAARQKKGHKK